MQSEKYNFLCEMEFNPHEVRLDMRKLVNLKNCNFEILCVFQNFLSFPVFG